MKRVVVFTVVIFCIAFSLPYWGRDDFEKAEVIPKGRPLMQRDAGFLRGNWQTWSYVHELCQTAAFISSMQVSDSLDPEFGGLIEGEDPPNTDVVETDNTQEAIWVWCRHHEITGDTTYFVNIRRAWIYVMNFPAYQEEGTGTDYYRVWNCGLALFAESKYRDVFNDTTYSWYADTCAVYILEHPLSFNVPDPIYQRLHPKTTSLAAGMLYQYGKEMSNQTYMDTALAYGHRVREWIESDTSTNINDEVWAMSGGTCVWGLCRSIFDEDTTFGISWLNACLPYMKYSQPTGNWNNSWNIWYANAYNFSARITDDSSYAEYHHSLTDSLLVQDYDDDGGVPPTSTLGEDYDHSWISSYMVFMGFEGLMDSIKDVDAGVNDIYATGPRPFFIPGDTIELSIRVANYGFLPLSNVDFTIEGPGYSADTNIDLGIGAEDTIRFATPWVPQDTGYFDFAAFSVYAGDEREGNDTFDVSLFVRPLRFVSGSIIDTTNGSGIYAKLCFQFTDDTGTVYFDSTATDSATGNFSIYLIDSLYRAYILTDIPYPDLVVEDIYVTPDSVSDLNFSLHPADILVINRDDEARYAEYYEKPLDTLNMTYKVWAPVNQGLFPMGRIAEFNKNTIIWYTGRAVTDNVTPEEQESLMVFLDDGGKLLITGQNIGEEISGTPFYSDYLHAQLIDDSIHTAYCYPDTTDSLGQNIGNLFTTGASGAVNQYSRDVIASDGSSHEFLFYDDSMTAAAGIWYDDPSSDYQVIYFGFGIEAIHKRPGYMSRTELLAEILDWFDVLAIEESVVNPVQPMFSIYPNPVCGKLTLYLHDATLHGKGTIQIYDAAGRLIKTLIHDRPLSTMIWDLHDAQGRRVPAGIYFVRLEIDTREETVKAVILR